MPPKNKTNLSAGIIITLIAYMFFAINSTLVRNVIHEIHTTEILFFQHFFSLLFIFPFAIRHGVKGLKTLYLPLHLVRDLTALGSFFFYFSAIKYLNLIDATVLSYTSPFFIPFVWRIWLKTKVRSEMWFTIIFGFIGIALILKPSMQFFQVGTIIGIAAGVAAALSLVSISILHQKHESTSKTLFYFFLVSSLVTFPFMSMNWTPPTPVVWYNLIGIGLSSAMGQLLLTYGYRFGTASYLSPLCYSIVIYISIISWLVFNNPPGWLTFFGSLVVISGGSLSYILVKRPTGLKKLFTRNRMPPKIDPSKKTDL